jgi:hypothetical protein
MGCVILVLCGCGSAHVVCSFCEFVRIRCNLSFVAFACSVPVMSAAAVLCALSSFATRESWGAGRLNVWLASVFVCVIGSMQPQQLSSGWQRRCCASFGPLIRIFAVYGQ